MKSPPRLYVSSLCSNAISFLVLVVFPHLYLVPARNSATSARWSHRSRLRDRSAAQASLELILAALG